MTAKREGTEYDSIFIIEYPVGRLCAARSRSAAEGADLAVNNYL